MKTKIYDYINNETEIELQDKPIEIMFVEIISGDEVLTVVYEDNTIQRFDSSESRFESFADGSYVVLKDQFDDWFAFDPEKDLDLKNPTKYSYAREEKFCKI